MYGVKLKNVEQVYIKSRLFIKYKEFLDFVISDKLQAKVQLTNDLHGNPVLHIKAVLLIPMLQQQIHELGTELKEFGVDLEES